MPFNLGHVNAEGLVEVNNKKEAERHTRRRGMEEQEDFFVMQQEFYDVTGTRDHRRTFDIVKF